MRKLLLFALLSFAAPARADWKFAAVETSGIEWASAEGAAFKLAPGLLVTDEGDPEQTFSLVHGFDVLSHADPYHHWDVVFTRGPNGAYLGTRYQNVGELSQVEAGVTLGPPFLNWGYGVIYDAKEKRLDAVTLRVTFPVLFLPVLFYNQLTEQNEPVDQD